MLTKLIFLATTCLAVMFTTHASGQDFVYRPINPAFGGDTFNYQWLLSSASEQNKYEETNDLDPLTDFQNNLDRQLLNQLARQLTSGIFGENGLQDGSYEVGQFIVNITSGADGLNVDISDINNASTTTIVIPYY